MDVSGSTIFAYLGLLILTLFLGGVGIFYLKIVLEKMLQEEFKKQAESNTTHPPQETIQAPPPASRPIIPSPPLSPPIFFEKAPSPPHKTYIWWQKFGLTALLGVLIFTILLPLSVRSFSQKQLTQVAYIEPFKVPAMSDLSETSDRMDKILQTYSQLTTSLNQQNWQTANQLTYELTLNLFGKKALSRGYIDYTELKSLPCDQLKQIDQLWREASEGKFGFSAQQIIYKNQGQNWEKYYTKVGWATLQENKFFTEVDQTLNWDTRRLEYPFNKQPNYQNPPIGHFPVTIGWVRGKKFPQFAELCEF